MVHEETTAACGLIALLRVMTVVRFYDWTAVEYQERCVHSYAHSIGNRFVGVDDVGQSVCAHEGVHRLLSNIEPVFPRIDGIGTQHCCNTPCEFIRNGRRLDGKGNGYLVEGADVNRLLSI